MMNSQSSWSSHKAVLRTQNLILTRIDTLREAVDLPFQVMLVPFWGLGCPLSPACVKIQIQDPGVVYSLGLPLERNIALSV
jgi:hypothetical protein